MTQGECGVGRRAFSWPVVLTALMVAASRPAFGQFQFSNRYELSETVYLDEVDNAVRTHLAQLDNYIQGEQWDEALTTLGLLLATYPDQLIDVGKRRFISLRDYCHRRYCSLPGEVLARYRSTADPQALAWLEEGVRAGDAATLRKIVEQTFASSWTDEALDRLAELALERGQASTARAYWEMILPPPKRVNHVGPDQPGATRLVYPDTNLSEASLNARLVLVSILEGDQDRAERELAEFQKRYPRETGRLAGREGVFAQLLEALMSASARWVHRATEEDWTTFAGSSERTKIAPRSLDLGVKRWEQPLLEVSFNELVAFAPGPSIRRVATSHPQTRAQQLLSYHPLVVDGLVLFNTNDEIYALDLASGRPAWSGNDPKIFGDTLTTTSARPSFHAVTYGVPRYCMTAEEHRLYARLGSPLTSALNDSTSERRGYLVCLDLKSQGRLLWKVYPDDEKLAFEGSPVVDGDSVYVALRHSDVRPQAHVWCLDADTGQRRWARQVCSAETIGRGQYEEATCNLLTLHEGALYFNTHLGAVARLSARDGHMDWVHVYREKQTGDLNQPQAYLRRDLTPCVYSDGRVFAAPSDSERIYALSADTGELLWDTRYTPDAVHLLGVGAGNLIASGDRLYWINCQTGKLARYWPDGHSPKGFGRGTLAGGHVYWPTRTAIFVFDLQTGRLERNFDLRAIDDRASGGNLLIADRTLLIASTNRLLAIGELSRLSEASSAAVEPAIDASRKPSQAR